MLYGSTAMPMIVAMIMVVLVCGRLDVLFIVFIGVSFLGRRLNVGATRRPGVLFWTHVVRIMSYNRGCRQMMSKREE